MGKRIFFSVEAINVWNATGGMYCTGRQEKKKQQLIFNFLGWLPFDKKKDICSYTQDGSQESGQKQKQEKILGHRVQLADPGDGKEKMVVWARTTDFFFAGGAPKQKVYDARYSRAIYAGGLESSP